MNALRRTAARGLAAGLRLWAATWRIRIEGPDPFAAEPGSTQIGATWHEDLLILAWFFRDRGFSVPVSRSSDGDWIASALDALGYAEPPRGSSSRGGAAALRALVRQLRDGTTVSIQLDGPRGPARVAKPGAIHLARLSERPLTPLVFDARPCLRFGSWDRTRLPLPFARVVLRYGQAIEVPTSLTDEEEAEHLARLTSSLRALSGPGGGAGQRSA